MSRNLVLVKVDGAFRSFNEAAEDEHLLSLGARGAVISAVDALFPGIVWLDGGTGEHGSANFEVGIDDPVEDLVVELKDDSQLDIVFDLCRANGWHATESGMGAFIDL